MKICDLEGSKNFTKAQKQTWFFEFGGKQYVAISSYFIQCVPAHHLTPLPTPNPSRRCAVRHRRHIRTQAAATTHVGEEQKQE